MHRDAGIVSNTLVTQIQLSIKKHKTSWQSEVYPKNAFGLT